MRHSRIQATAYHEAGHAAAAIKLGIGLGRKGVSIKPDADSFGYADIFKGFSGNPKYGFFLTFGEPVPVLSNGTISG